MLSGPFGPSGSGILGRSTETSHSRPGPRPIGSGEHGPSQDRSPLALLTYMHFASPPAAAPLPPRVRAAVRCGLSVLLAAAMLPARLPAQAAIDPNIAPRAAALEREG